MTRKKKFRETRSPRRKLFFERPYGIRLEDLLDIYMHVIGNIDAELDMKIDKITIQLEANKTELEKTISDLQTLQGQLIRATETDENGNYCYEQGLFPHIFKAQIQTKFLTQILKAHNYDSELTKDKTIISNVPIYELKRLQRLGVNTINEAPREQNKDIQRFSSIVSIKTGKSQDEILQLGLVNGLLLEKEGKLRFADQYDKVLEQIIEIVNDLSISPAQPIANSESTDEGLEGFGFDGGKIVFVNASNDRERSTFEDEENKE